MEYIIEILTSFPTNSIICVIFRSVLLFYYYYSDGLFFFFLFAMPVNFFFFELDSEFEARHSEFYVAECWNFL